MHPLAAASRSRLTVRNVLLYMRSHGSALFESVASPNVNERYCSE